MAQPSPTPASGQTLVLPQPTVERDGELPHSSTTHSRTTSGAVSYVDTPPITPRSLTFNAPVNPFSPPASVLSFSSPDLTPANSPGLQHQSHSHYPFPDVATPRSGITSVATSVSDLPRMSSSYYGSRPNTADYAGLTTSTRPSSARLREAFTSPPPRPLTMYSTANFSTKVERERPKSTMLITKDSLHKPWIQSRDPYARIAYFLTYGVMLIGIAAGVVRCYTGWHDVPLMKGNLCMVMDEDFTNGEEGIFGENGKFFREVDMSGFGYISSSLWFHPYLT